MFKENDPQLQTTSSYLPQESKSFQERLVSELDYFEFCKSEFLSGVSVKLYSCDFLGLMKLVEESLPKFFDYNLALKMILLKLEFFNLFLTEKSNEQILEFYNFFLVDIIKENYDFHKTGDWLSLISNHPEIIKSRFYQSKFEYVCSIFLIAFERAVIQIYFPDGTYRDSRHTCHMNTNCRICDDEFLFIQNFQRVCFFEEEVWLHYLNNQNSFLVFNPAQEDVLFDYESGNIFHVEDQNKNDINFYQMPEYTVNDLGKFSNLDFYYNEYQFNSNELILKNETMVDIKEIFKFEDIDGNESTPSVKNCKQKFSVSKIPEEIHIENMNFNNKKLKAKIPFFKEFNFKFTKRENIDKKVLRKSRKFLKDKLKKNLINWDSFDLNENEVKFWIDYLKLNLLPPMSYYDRMNGKNIEFKSFNTNFIMWLFSHKGSIELFEIYLQEKSEEIMNHFLKKFTIETEEESRLVYYIQNLSRIFYNDGKCDIQTYNEFISVQELNENNGKEEEVLTTLAEGKNTTVTNSWKNSDEDEDGQSDDEKICTNCEVFSNVKFDPMLSDKNLYFLKESSDNCNEKEELGKMFNNSFKYDNDCMFSD